MGQSIEFPSNGEPGQGYLAVPEGGEGSGLPLIVFQEWWGLNAHIKDVTERFAKEGFTALAPDLYRGKTTKEPDEAAKDMMAMDMARVAKDMSGAVDELMRRTGRSKVGVVGFCMGGGLALVLACQRPDAIAACVPFYGAIPWPDAQPDYSKLKAAVQGHYASEDGWADPVAVGKLEDTLRQYSDHVEMNIYQGAQHAFFNDERPEVYNEDYAQSAFTASVDFLKRHL